jgi:hypothetical protein
LSYPVQDYCKQNFRIDWLGNEVIHSGIHATHFIFRKCVCGPAKLHRRKKLQQQPKEQPAMDRIAQNTAGYFRVAKLQSS